MCGSQEMKQFVPEKIIQTKLSQTKNYQTTKPKQTAKEPKKYEINMK